MLEAAPHRTASDLLLTVPGAFVTQHSGEGKAHQIFYRGFDALHGQDLEIWVAGAPVNQISNVHGQGYADLHFVPPEVVQQLDALPGSFAPTQGDFAVAGTMRFQLGYEEPGFTTRLTLGSFGARRLFLAYHPPQRSEASFGAVELYETNGFGVGRAAQRASAVTQWVHPMKDDGELRVMASTYTGRFGSAGVLRLADIESGRIDRLGSYDTNQGGQSSRSQLTATLRGSAGGYSYEIAPYLVRTDLQLRHDYTGFLEDPAHGDATQQLNQATTFGMRGSLRGQFRLLSDHDSVEVGLASRDDEVVQSEHRVRGTAPEITATTIDARVHALAIGGYVDARLHPLRRVALRGGVRVDSLSFGVRDDLRGGGAKSSQGMHVGPRATVDVALSPGLHALASYAEGFRSPQARSLGDGERTPFTDVRSCEGGVRYAQRRLHASVASFITRLSDDVVFLETVGRNQPVPATQRVGGTLDFVARPQPWLTSSLGVTYTRATFREGSADYDVGALVPFVPQVVLRTDLAAHARLTEVWGRDLVGTVGWGSTYLYRRPIPYGEWGSDVYLVDARAAVRRAEIELGIEAFNLFDLAWNDGEFVYASNFDQTATPSLLPVRHVTAGAPRTWLATLTIYLS